MLCGQRALRALAMRARARANGSKKAVRARGRPRPRARVVTLAHTKALVATYMETVRDTKLIDLTDYPACIWPLLVW